MGTLVVASVPVTLQLILPIFIYILCNSSLFNFLPDFCHFTFHTLPLSTFHGNPKEILKCKKKTQPTIGGIKFTANTAGFRIISEVLPLPFYNILCHSLSLCAPFVFRYCVDSIFSVNILLEAVVIVLPNSDLFLKPNCSQGQSGNTLASHL